MRKNFVLLFSTISLLFSFVSCSYITVKDHTKKETEEESVLTPEQVFIKNLAALQYIDYATVVGDTAYLGVPSSRGTLHGQDNIAAIFLKDIRKNGQYTAVKACRVVNVARDFVFTDSIVSGQTIGYADVEAVEKK